MRAFQLVGEFAVDLVPVSGFSVADQLEQLLAELARACRKPVRRPRRRRRGRVHRSPFCLSWARSNERRFTRTEPCRTAWTEETVWRMERTWKMPGGYANWTMTLTTAPVEGALGPFVEDWPP